MSYLWQKEKSEAVDERVMRFLAGEDVILDRELLTFDIRASQAHARGLARIGILTNDQAEAMVGSLDALQAAFVAGEFVLDGRFEDGHSAIESWLTGQLGEIGGRIHAGRSRNDQVAVALRLYMKDKLADLAELCTQVARVCLDRAAIEADVVLPGHTHLQQAMPSSLGLWWAGHAEAFIDNVDLARSIANWLDASPLGTASGFGVNFPLDRDGVAAELDFDRVLVNPQYAQNSRGKTELRALDALAAATGDLRRISWDLSLYASQEFGFREYSAGLLHRLVDHAQQAQPRHRRTAALLTCCRRRRPRRAGSRPESAVRLSARPAGHQAAFIARLWPRPGRPGDPARPAGRIGAGTANACGQSVAPALHATDRANELVAAGKPFREAYRQAAAELDQFDKRHPEDSLKARVSPGGCANLLLDRLEARLGGGREKVEREKGKG
jgi:argininosuccinate lyase